MSKMKRQNTMSYYSTLFQKYRVDDRLLDSRTRKRAIGSVLERIDRKKVKRNDILDTSRLKRLRRAFQKTQWFKQVAIGLTFGAAVALFQAPPVEAKVAPPHTAITKSDFAPVAIDTDSSIPSIDNKQVKPEDKALDSKQRETTSLHFIANKPAFNEYIPPAKNSVLLDDDSDVAYSSADISRHLTVIDTGIEDWQTLAQTIQKGSVLLLNKENGNPLDAILGELKKIGNVESLNIISHGASGELDFSEKRISQESLQANREKWQELGSYLNKEGDINLFGCNVAQGQKGQEFIKELAKLTSADVAASLNPTGSSEQGGDWALERVVGEVESFQLMSESLGGKWNHILAEHSLRVATSKGKNTYTIDDYTVTAYFFIGTYPAGTSIWTSSDRTIYIQRTDGKAFNFDGLYLFSVGANAQTVKMAGNTTSTSTATVDCDVFDTYTFPNSYGAENTVIGDTPDFNAVYAVKAYISATNWNTEYYSPKFYASGPVITNDTDSTVTAGGGAEATSLATTATGTGSAITLFDFTITDTASSDSDPTAVSSFTVDVDVTSTATDAERGLLTFVLNGPDATNVAGTYGSGTDQITFSGLSISVASGTQETYSVSAYFNDNTSSNDITEGHTLILTTNASDFTTTGTSSTFAGSQGDVNNGSGAVVDVTATTLVFSQEPSSTIISGSVFGTQPIVQAVDARGNVDTGYGGDVVLGGSFSGSLGGTTTLAASGGVASFSGISYSASSDDDANFFITAASDGLTSVNSGTINPDVVATKLVFTTQPAPTALSNGVLMDFTTDPVVEALDADDLRDTDFNETVTISENDGSGTGVFTNNSVAAGAGLATFTGLTLTHDNDATFQLVADDATGGIDPTAATSSSLTVTSNAVPVTTLPGAPTVREDDSSIAIADTIEIADGDGDSQDVTLTATGGTLSMATAGVNLTSGDGSDDVTIAFNGTLVNVNAALDSLTFTPDADVAGVNVGAIRIQTSDGNGGSDDDTLQFTILDAPEVSSINRLTPASSLTNEDSLIYRVTFSESVSGIDATDFTISGSTASVTAVSAASGSTSDITISGGDLASLNGSVRLDITDDNSIVNASSVPLGGMGSDDYSGGQSYTLDNVAPIIGEITAVSSPTTDNSPDYTFTTNDAGTIALGGSCGTSSSKTIGTTGNQTITLTQTDDSTPLSDGSYSDCTLILSDSAGNASNTVNISAFSVDTTGPGISTLLPADGSTGAGIAANLVATFDENIVTGSGNVVLFASDSSVIETFDIATGAGDNGGSVSVSGTTLTINPGSNLAFSTNYYVQIAATAIDDMAGNSYAGITNATSWNFTSAADTIPPTISNVSIPNSPMEAGDTVTATLMVGSDTDDYTSGSGGINGTIAGYALGSLRKSNDTTYTATFTITAGGADVAAGEDIPVSITLDDSAGNTSSVYTTAISQDNDPISRNIPPTLVGLPASFTIDEDVLTSLPLGTLSFADIEDSPITATFVVTRGVLVAADGDGTYAGVAIAGSNGSIGSTSMTFTGTAASLNTYFDTAGRVKYQTEPNDTSAAALSVTPNDGTASGATSNSTINVTAVNDAPFFTGTPAITGYPKKNHTLGLKNTDTDDVDGDMVRLQYQWKADGAEIPGAISPTYLVTGDDDKKNITCTLSAIDGNGGVTPFTTTGVWVNKSFPWHFLLPGLISSDTLSKGLE